MFSDKQKKINLLRYACGWMRGMFYVTGRPGRGYRRKCPSVRARRQFTGVQQMNCVACPKGSRDGALELCLYFVLIYLLSPRFQLFRCTSVGALHKALCCEADAAGKLFGCGARRMKYRNAMQTRKRSSHRNKEAYCYLIRLGRSANYTK